MTNVYPKKNKYHATRTADGFPSKLESSVYGILQLREKAGEISDIKRQVPVILQDGPPDVKIAWRLDFSFIENSTKQIVYVEAKGIPTGEYKLKLKLWRKNPPGPLEIYMGHYSKPSLVERIG